MIARLNAEWHRAHPMPKNATEFQRVQWHRAHEKFCACRPMPPRIRKLIDADSAASAQPALRELLSGGDRRSIANSNRVRAIVEANPALVSELAALTSDSDWLVSLRALDLLEKLAHDHILG
jgi:hypothetical protein